MFSNPFRPLVALLCIVVVFAGGVLALADTGRRFGRKEQMKFDRLVAKDRKEARNDIRFEGRILELRGRRLRKDVKKGRISGEERQAALDELCAQLEEFRSPIETITAFETQEVDGDSQLASDIVVSAARRAIGALSLNGDVISALGAVPDSVQLGLESELRALRQELAAKVDEEKRKIDEALGEENTEPAKFVFRRNFETHEVRPLDGGDPQVFVRPGIQRLEVTEGGDVKIELAVAFDEPDSFVRVELKRPDGTVFGNFVAQQKDSTNGGSRVLAFEFTLDSLPAPGETVLFTASSGFDQSFLSLVDPFDCLAFLFPDLVTPQTPSSAKPD